MSAGRSGFPEPASARRRARPRTAADPDRADSDGDHAAALALQARWRDGVFAEIAHWPAACVTPLDGLDDRPATELIGLAKLIVPFGGLQRTGLRGGQTIIINGASGYFGSGAVMLAVAMGAGRVVAVGRKREALESRCAKRSARV